VAAPVLISTVRSSVRPLALWRPRRSSLPSPGRDRCLLVERVREQRRRLPSHQPSTPARLLVFISHGAGVGSAQLHGCAWACLLPISPSSSAPSHGTPFDSPSHGELHLPLLPCLSAGRSFSLPRPWPRLPSYARRFFFSQLGLWLRARSLLAMAAPAPCTQPGRTDLLAAGGFGLGRRHTRNFGARLCFPIVSTTVVLCLCPSAVLVVVARLLASSLFDKTPKSIDCRRIAVICDCLCHLHQLARPTALYTSPSRVVVELAEPRSFLLNLVVAVESSNTSSPSRPPPHQLAPKTISSSFRASSKNSKDRMKTKLTA
jgi:hypothetical protein